MRLLVYGKNIDMTEVLRAYVKYRLSFALGRFEPRLARVAVRLADLNGPRGGVDKRCRIGLTLVPRGAINVEEVDANLHAAIDRAAERAGRSVGRELEQRREKAQGRPLGRP